MKSNFFRHFHVQQETIRIEDEPYVPRKEVNTALASNKNIPVVEAKVPTKNIAGPPVYYPPNKELFAKSEAQAAWRAGVCKTNAHFLQAVQLFTS